jgi:hypothetical protein
MSMRSVYCPLPPEMPLSGDWSSLVTEIMNGEIENPISKSQKVIVIRASHEENGRRHICSAVNP